MQANITVNLEVSELLLPLACQQLPSRAKRAKAILKLFVAVLVIKDLSSFVFIQMNFFSSSELKESLLSLMTKFISFLTFTYFLIMSALKNK